MRYISWAPRRLLEIQYHRALKRLFHIFMNLLEGRDITDPHQIMNELRKFVTTDYFKGFANAAAKRMITGQLVDSARTWRQAALKGTMGRTIYEALMKEMQGPVGWTVQRLIDENAKLISTFPDSISNQVANYIKTETYKGRRAEAIAQDLMMKFPDISANRINMIARTEASKASTAITQSRSERMGWHWYIWRTSEDARVRDSHHLMDGVLVNWDDPPQPEKMDGEKKAPAPYHAGNIYYCRCFPQPVLDLNRVTWPHKVHRNGTIQMMTRAQFEALGEWRRKIAA